MLGLVILLLGLAQPATAEETAPTPKQIANEMVSRFKPLLAKEEAMELVFLSGSATISNEDLRILSEQFTTLGISQQNEAQEILARYKKLQGQHFPFRVDPLEASGKNGVRYICVVKLDDETPYTLESILSFLRLDRSTLNNARVDPAMLSVSRIYRHIVYHELWHCLDRTQMPALENFAAQVESIRIEKDLSRILPAMLTNYAEIGADLFATAVDIQDQGNTHCIDFLISLRETNLLLKHDIEHYSAPALQQLKAVPRAFFTSASLKQLVELVIKIRRASLDPQTFVNQYRTLLSDSP